MSRVGLVLGGGGITGASFEMATLMALELATGWSANDAEVIVGTSSGSFVASLVRSDALELDSIVGPQDDRADVTERIRRHVFSKGPGPGLGTWVRHGVLPGVRRPGLNLFMGAPAPYHAGGLAEWVVSQVGPNAADAWPIRPTAIVAHDITAGVRVAFGTDNAPDVALADAVAASSAIPLLFRPYRIGDGLYVDGGVSSGTHADLVLGSPDPLDLVLVVAPLAASEIRKRARFHERMFDRVGNRSLSEEISLIKDAWPDCEVVTLYPAPSVQSVARPNPMDPDRSVPTFMRTLISMKRTLSQPEIWEPLSHHLRPASTRRRAASG
ncbi:MAG: patatin-like phospholipase family protein [Acidimicrobiales bacterium]|jgi:NTE family protein|nr:patatin-like phospholipase family protein [Acidimicrobiales bacterium]HLV89679.1 patatin-like phospholipase family protein [Acidimicrobiia bacterium]